MGIFMAISCTVSGSERYCTACIYAASMVLTGNSMGITMKFGINTTLVELKMEISLNFAS